MCFLHKKTSSRSTQTRQKDDTKFVILNATFNIFKVNATGSVYRGCIYFENLLEPALAVFFLFISLTNLENSVKCVLVPHLLQNCYIYLLYIKICYSQ